MYFMKNKKANAKRKNFALPFLENNKEERYSRVPRLSDTRYSVTVNCGPHTLGGLWALKCWL